MWPWAQHVGYGLMLLIAAVASISDVRSGVIRNRFLLVALAVVVAVQTALLASAAGAFGSGLGDGSLETAGRHATALVINVAVGVVVAVALYAASLWSPGDAKLTMVLAAAQPVWAPVQSPLPWAPVVVLLANAVLAALVFLAAEVVLRGVPRLVKRARDRSKEPPWPAWRGMLLSGARAALGAAAVATSLGPLRQWVGGRAQDVVSGGSFLAFLVLFVLYKPLLALMRRKSGLAAAALLFGASVAWSLWSRGAAGAEEVGRSVLISLAVVATRGVLDLSSLTFDSRTVSGADLRPGMVLASRQIARLEADPRWKEAFRPFVGDLHGVKLDENLVANVREWHAHNAPRESIAVDAPLPFAPFLAIAVALTAVWGRICCHL